MLCFMTSSSPGKDLYSHTDTKHVLDLSCQHMTFKTAVNVRTQPLECTQFPPDLAAPHPSVTLVTGCKALQIKLPIIILCPLQHICLSICCACLCGPHWDLRMLPCQTCSAIMLCIEKVAAVVVVSKLYNHVRFPRIDRWSVLSYLAKCWRYCVSSCCAVMQLPQ